MKKAERVLDLITFLLNAREPVSFEEIQNEFPEDYREGAEEAIARKFERDKADIVALGLPLRFINDEDSARFGYVIDRDAYAMPELQLGPEELAVLYLAGSAVLAMESTPFTRDLVMALNKIGFSADGPSPLRVLPANRLEQPAALRRKDYLETMRRAIASRKSVILFYHSLWRNEQTKRTIDPYGLACTRGTWFLVGHCHLRDAVRVFHVDRVTGLEVNRFKPKTPDFEFPGDFRLSDHVSKHPWRLKVHEPREVTLRVLGPVADVFVNEVGGDAEVVDEDHQARVVRMQASFLEGLLPTLLWYRDKVRVLEPAELVEKAKTALGRLAAEAP